MAATEDGVTRRGLLAGLAFVAAATATSEDAEARRRLRRPALPGVLVFRLSTRKTMACKACRRHHRYMVFLTHQLANAHRAHRGCNCPIERQRLRPKMYRRLFPKGSAGVVDLRTVRREGGLKKGRR